MRPETIFEITFYVTIALSLVAAFGWVANIYKLFGDDFAPISKAEVIRIIGIPVAPIGIVTGFITFDEEMPK